MALLAGTVTGCSLTQTIEERAEAELQDRLESVHESFLHARSLDPTSTGAAALEALDPYGDAVASSTDRDVVTLVETIGVRIIEGGGLDYEDLGLGACIRVRVEAGSGGADRGHVTTEPVRCPRGVDVVVDGYPVDEVTTALEGRSDDVGEPPPPRPVCHSGEICTEGGG
jgi:hypothetical protein